MLKVDLRVGESLKIGTATVRLEKKSGQIATLVIDADRTVPVRRLANPADSVAAEKGIFGSVATA